MLLHLLTDILRNSVMITGLVVIMMMLIESIDLESGGRFFGKFRNSRAGQTVVAAILGSIPGCIGGFAAVSLYSQRILSFGALVAMMIASTGDEAFMLIALKPDKALWLFLLLFVLAVTCGIIIDLAGIKIRKHGNESFSAEGCIDSDLSSGGCCSASHKEKESGGKRHPGWKRIVLLVGVIIFLGVLVSGLLSHEHHHTVNLGESIAAADTVLLNILDEKWMNILFTVLSLGLIAVIWRADDHFVEHRLWEHIVKKHLPVIFAWTFGVLAVIGIGMAYIDITGWISRNTAAMILLAALIGLIPESGPHMIFVSLWAAGIVPLPVLLASCISQDGHSSLPLLAEDRRSFAYAKLLNCLIAVLAGFGAMFLM